MSDIVIAVEFKASGKILFYGNIEGRDVFSGKTQVVVCSGFVGNIILKLAESFLPTLRKALHEKVHNSGFDQKAFAWIANKLLTPTIGSLRKDFDYEEYGGLPLLGVPYPVIIAHGGSSPKAIANAINKGCIAAQQDVPGKIKKQLQTLSAMKV